MSKHRGVHSIGGARKTARYILTSPTLVLVVMGLGLAAFAVGLRYYS